MTDSHITLIVSAHLVGPTRTLCASWPGGVGMLTTPCYTEGVVTHYISSGKIKSEIAALLLEADAAGIAALILEQDPESTVTEQQIQGIFAGSDISQDAASVALARQELTLSGPEVI